MKMYEKNETSVNEDITLIIMVCMIIAMLFTIVRGGEKKSITIKGSDTMVHLVSNWAEEFMKINPKTEIAVTGGGSGTGIAALINGTTEICAASREMKKKEKQQAMEKGTEVREVVVARDGIAVVVNPKNTVKELNVQQIAQIFTGAYTKWSQIGGSDEGILVFSRESSSGTYAFFQEHVLKNKDYTPKAKLMPATSAIIESVSTDEGAIGYVGLGYALAAGDKVKIVAVKADANSPAVMPSDETVINGKYPIARPLYLYVGTNATADVTTFVDFCLSDAGQVIVREAGYVAIKR
ncbi:MAG: PstS family phosphate ABC transporter substrate-binding protein [Phycisphaerae bacterium]|nr:PstS family phosphate ABC transporter substrate-binding protein [Phycisphaerae bacterium]MDD5380715.1 PstS family phosphate ABC transporter substrate-binding protein [Phycisphaerae bacterium]